MIVWFDDLRKNDSPLVGGKAANLGELLAAGISVPPGFAITVRAFNRYLDGTGLAAFVSSELEGLEDDPASLEPAAERIEALLQRTSIPEEVCSSVYEAYEDLARRCGLEDLPVAVRSSAVAEDLESASFAGQFESFLNVIGKEAVVEKIARCWASLFTGRAIAYRRSLAHIEAGAMGVAVQKCVNAKAAGVAFTLHPTSCDPNKVMIEGNWGLGASITDGIVIPDRFIINKADLSVENASIGEKGTWVVLLPDGGGVEATSTPLNLRGVPCLTPEEVQRIAALAIACEKLYGGPQGVEWVVDKDLPFPDSVVMVQTRPISTRVKTADPMQRVVDAIAQFMARPNPHPTLPGY